MATVDQILSLARAELGVPYVFGGTDPRTGFDCSGLVRYVYGQAGISLPRTAQEQYDATTRVDQPQAGDLVFFSYTYDAGVPITHVGIVTGPGEMITAPNTGESVRTEGYLSGYWAQHYAGGGRVNGITTAAPSASGSTPSGLGGPVEALLVVGLLLLIAEVV